MAEKGENPVDQRESTQSEEAQKTRKDVQAVHESAIEYKERLREGDFTKGTIHPDKKG